LGLPSPVGNITSVQVDGLELLYYTKDGNEAARLIRWSRWSMWACNVEAEGTRDGLVRYA